MKPSDSALLELGDTFPPLALQTLDHGEISLPSEEWTILLIYRGEW